jgi:hypothetical protein
MFMVGGPSLLMITPALLLFARWYWAMMFGSNKPDRPFPYAPPAEPPMGDKLLKIIDYLAPTRGEHEYWYLGALWVVCAIALVAGNRERARARSELPVFELAFILTLAAYVAFPFWLQYESTSPRLFDLAVLAFPLVLFPRAPRLRSRAALAVALVFVFCVARVRYVGEQLRVLNEVDYGGFVATANTCARVVPHERVNKLAYANGLQDVKSFKAAAAHQLYETFAAQCGLEAPVYDTHVNYNHLLALRYAGAMPAPRTMIGTDHWYDHPKLWDDFEYVLVREWNPSRRDDAALAPRARLVARYGGYQLWERK